MTQEVLRYYLGTSWVLPEEVAGPVPNPCPVLSPYVATYFPGGSIYLGQGNLDPRWEEG